MDLGIKGKWALVCGASKGLGLGCAQALAAEFGAICAFLCSAQAGYITGQNVLADGGAYPGTF